MLFCIRHLIVAGAVANVDALNGVVILLVLLFL